MKRLVLLVLLVCFGVTAWAQTTVTSGGSSVKRFSGAPTGACGTTDTAVDTTTGTFYSCNSGTWLQVGPGAAGSAAFNTLTGGTNAGQALVIGNGSTLDVAGTGTINATSYKGITTPTATEFGYLSGVTSAIQTQFGARALTTTTITAGTGLSGGGDLSANRTLSLAIPTRSVIGGVFISAACTSGQHVSDINQTTGALVCSADTGGSMVYPGAGVPNSTGSAWGTSYTVGTAANNLVQLDGLAKLPAVDGSQLTNLPSGSGTVNSGTQYQFGYYATTGTGISGNSRLTENSGGTTLTYSGTLGVSAVKFTSTDTVNNGQLDWQAGSGGDTTCATAASAHVLGCYRNNELEVSNNGDAYSKVLRASDLTVANVVTAASAAGAANQVVISGGADKTVSYVTADTTTTHVLAATAGAPAFRALATTDLPATSNIRSIGCGMGSPTSSTALTTSETCYVVVPYACTIAGWNILVDAGTATVKTWRVATGTAIPTVTNSISTSGVSISTGTAVHSTTVTDFTSTAISANDIVAFNLSAVATAKFVYFSLQCNQ